MINTHRSILVLIIIVATAFGIMTAAFCAAAKQCRNDAYFTKLLDEERKKNSNIVRVKQTELDTLKKDYLKLKRQK